MSSAVCLKVSVFDPLYIYYMEKEPQHENKNNSNKDELYYLDENDRKILNELDGLEEETEEFLCQKKIEKVLLPARQEEIKKIKERVGLMGINKVELSFPDNLDDSFEHPADDEGGLENKNAHRIVVDYYFGHEYRDEDPPHETKNDIIIEKIPIENAPDGLKYDTFYKLKGFEDQLFVGDFKQWGDDYGAGDVAFGGWRIIGDTKEALIDIVNYSKLKDDKDNASIIKWEQERKKEIQFYNDLLEHISNGYITGYDALYMFEHIHFYNDENKPRRPKEDNAAGSGNDWFNKYRDRILKYVAGTNQPGYYDPDEKPNYEWNGVNLARIKK